MTWNDIFIAFQEGRENVLFRKMYRDYRNEFVGWALKNFRMNEEDAADAFQNMMLVLYLNITLNKIDPTIGSPKAFLYGVGRNLLLRTWKSKSRIDLLDEIDDYIIKNFDFEIFNKIDEDHRNKVIEKSIGKLGEKCQQIIRLFYFQNIGHEEIARRMDYNNEEVSRARLYRCRNRLKEFLNWDDLV